MSTNGEHDESPNLEDFRDSQRRDQLVWIRTPYTNATLRGPEGTDVGDLPCELAVDPEHRSVVTVSAWELDERQRALVAAGAHLRMSVWQHPIPPLALAIEAPFCNCGSVTIYVKNEGAFACPNCGERVKTGSYESRDEIPRLELPDGVNPPDQKASSQAAHQQAKRDFIPQKDEGETPSTDAT
jgi:predicted RNA-binding Zn-ribbon protein involved in translation (DUF1610 family)